MPTEPKMQHQILVEAVGEFALNFIDYELMGHEIAELAKGAGGGAMATPLTTPAAGGEDASLIVSTAAPLGMSDAAFDAALKGFAKKLERELETARTFLEGKIAALSHELTELEAKVESPSSPGSAPSVDSASFTQPIVATTPAAAAAAEMSTVPRMREGSDTSNAKQHLAGPSSPAYGAMTRNNSSGGSLFGRSIAKSSFRQSVNADVLVRHQQHVSFVRVRALHTSVLKLQRFAILNSKIARQCALDFCAAMPLSDAQRAQVIAHVESTLSGNALVTALPEIEALALRYEAFLQSRFPGDYEDVVRTSDADSSSLVNWHIKWRYMALSAVVFILLMAIPMGILREAQNCAAVLGVVTVLWVTEAIPFFTAAMLIPLLAAPFGVIPGKTRAEEGETLLAKTFDHTQILVMGGLCLGKALAKHKLETVASRVLLRRIAHRPNLYLLAVMLTGAFACSVVSNVTAPLLMLSVIQPSLWEMDRDSGAPQAILLGLAFACNFGGMLSPIASPQNAVAVQAIGSSTGQAIGFEVWLITALPLVLFEIVLVWALLILIMKPFKDVKVIPMPLGGHAATLQQDQLQRGYHAEASRKEKVEVAIIVVVFVLTVILWCIPKDEGVGDSGIVALIPIVTFFGLGILTKNDFNGLSWHLMFLLAGGKMLGYMAKESTLLDIIVNSMQSFWTTHSQFVVIFVLLITMLAVASFVSHTVASLIFLPLIAEVARTNPELPGPAVLVYIAVQMASGAMAFAVTSFPNVNSLLAEDAEGKPYLTAKSYLLIGSVASVTSLLHLMSYMVPYATALLPGRVGAHGAGGNATIAPMPTTNASTNMTLW